MEFASRVNFNHSTLDEDSKIRLKHNKNSTWNQRLFSSVIDGSKCPVFTAIFSTFRREKKCFTVELLFEAFSVDPYF